MIAGQRPKSVSIGSGHREKNDQTQANNNYVKKLMTESHFLHP
jgi:hypothetical protein